MATPDLSNAPDQDVVTLASEGDEAAQRELVRRFEPVVFNLVLRIVRRTDAAEDQTQEIFLRLFKALEERGPTRDPAAWVRKLARNATINYVNRKRLDASYKPNNVTPGAIPLAAPSDTPRPAPNADKFAKELRRAIRRLKPRDRPCARLFLLEGRTHREIAETLDLPLGTVKTTLRRAKQELREPLGHWLDSVDGD
jgi:RNA polymerase sigma-70 factor (ECF subfamily)